MAIKIDNKENKIEKVDGSQGIVYGDLEIDGELTVNGQPVVVKSSEPGSDTTTFDGNVKICKTSTDESGEHRIGYKVDNADYNFTEDNQTHPVMVDGYNCGTLTGSLGAEKYIVSYEAKTGWSMQQQEGLSWKDTDFIPLDTESMSVATVRFIYSENGNLTVEGKTNIGGTLTVGGETIIKGDTEIKGDLKTTGSINGVDWRWKEFTFIGATTIEVEGGWGIYKATGVPCFWSRGSATMLVKEGVFEPRETDIDFDVSYSIGSQEVTGTDKHHYYVACGSTGLTIKSYSKQIMEITGKFKVLTFE